MITVDGGTDEWKQRVGLNDPKAAYLTLIDQHGRVAWRGAGSLDEPRYKLWRHTHRFSERNGGTLIADTVEYALPFGLLGQLVHRLQVARDLGWIFDYRTQQVQL